MSKEQKGKVLGLARKLVQQLFDLAKRMRLHVERPVKLNVCVRRTEGKGSQAGKKTYATRRNKDWAKSLSIKI